MKILIVGSWVFSIYEKPLGDAFKSLGHDVEEFQWGKELGFEPLSNRCKTPKNPLKSFWARLQNKFIIGPCISRINKKLRSLTHENKYDLIFLYRPTHIWPETIKSIRKSKAIIITYNNDDPFTSNLPKYLYRYYIQSLKFTDWIFSYRHKNIQDYIQLGYQNCSILKSSYDETIHFYISNYPKTIDVSFIGHFEQDGRDDYLFKLFKETEYRIEIWGENWQASKHYHFFRDKLKREIKPLFGTDYNKTINSSKVALVFLSKINNDGYTRRCFEIPATKTPMLAERHSLLQEMFREDSEAAYFESPEELVEKVNFLLQNPKQLASMGEKGHQRLIHDKHEIKDRAREILSIFEKLRKEKRDAH